MESFVDLIEDGHHLYLDEEDHILNAHGMDRRNYLDSRSWDVDHNSHDDVAIGVHGENIHEEGDCIY